MRSLRVVPPSELDVAEDGSYDIPDPSSHRAGGSGDAGRAGIVVQAEDGERFQLNLDDALRAAIGPITTAGSTGVGSTGVGSTGRTSTATGSASAAAPEPAAKPRPRLATMHPLTPREIQTRVRAGESAQDLADDSDTPMDKIMRFAYAVLEERSRVADEARRARARRDGDGNLVPFGETVDGRFAAHDIEPQSVEWDSFRRPDGSWVVSAAWTADGTERHAHWAFSLTARTVLPLDQVSSDLLSDRPLQPVVRVVPDQGDTALVELYDQDAPDSHGYTAPSPPAGWLRAGAAGATPRTSAEPERHPRLPLRLAEPWSYGAPSSGVRVGADGPSVEDMVTSEGDPGTGDDLDAGSAGPDAGGDTRLDALFGDDRTDDQSVPPATKPSGSGRGRGARNQSKVPRWDDILLSTRRKND